MPWPYCSTSRSYELYGPRARPGPRLRPSWLPRFAFPSPFRNLRAHVTLMLMDDEPRLRLTHNWNATAVGQRETRIAVSSVEPYLMAKRNMFWKPPWSSWAVEKSQWLRLGYLPSESIAVVGKITSWSARIEGKCQRKFQIPKSLATFYFFRPFFLLPLRCFPIGNFVLLWEAPSSKRNKLQTKFGDNDVAEWTSWPESWRAAEHRRV